MYIYEMEIYYNDLEAVIQSNNGCLQFPRIQQLISSQCWISQLGFNICQTHEEVMFPLYKSNKNSVGFLSISS